MKSQILERGSNMKFPERDSEVDSEGDLRAVDPRHAQILIDEMGVEEPSGRRGFCQEACLYQRMVIRDQQRWPTRPVRGGECAQRINGKAPSWRRGPGKKGVQVSSMASSMRTLPVAAGCGERGESLDRQRLGR